MATTRGQLTHETYRQITLDVGQREALDIEARATPDEATAGEPLHLRLQYTPQGFDLPTGTELIITVPRYWRKHLGMAFRELHPELDTNTERHPGGSFCLVNVYPPESSDLVVEREIISAGFSFALHMVITQGTLRGGETLTVYLSDPISPEIEVPKMAGIHPFDTVIKLPGDGFFRPVAEPPKLVAHGGCAARLRLRCPSVAPADAEVTLRLVAVDGVGENGAGGYDAQVKVWRWHTDMAEAKAVQHTSEKRASHVRLQSGSEQFAYFHAYDDENALAARSNPMGRPNDFGGYNVYFGDLHTHYLDTTPDKMTEPFEYGAWYSNLDFCACVYQHNSCNVRFTQAVWHHYVDVNERYHRPGEFVTIPGCETYISCGHRIAYFRSSEQARDFQVAWERGPEYDLGDPRRAGLPPQPEALWAALEGFEAITIPHHSRYIWPADWTKPLAQRECCVEIYSRWGTSEIGGPHSVQEALIKGHRLGFVANTDNQMAQPGNGPFGVNDGRGLTGVLAADLTREALYDALKARRCYGTTGEQMLIYFALGDNLMGSEVRNYAGPRNFIVRAAGTKPLASIELVRNNEVIARAEPAGLTFSNTISDDTPLEDVMVEPYFQSMEPFCFYYVRVKQIDGQMAWASPIWIT